MRAHLLLLASLLVACTGDAGPAGAPGGNGTNGTNGTNGSDGSDVIISTRAKHGLDIAPVMLDLTGKTPDQIEQIGQGSYWVNAVIDCSGCHSPGPMPSQYLSGGVPFDLGGGNKVFSRNLTPDPTTGLMLTEDQFLEVIHTGRDFNPTQGGNGQLLVMPWPMLRWMHTDDLKSIYAYLKAIPAVGNQVPGDDKPALMPIPQSISYDVGDVVRPLTAETDFMGNPVPDPDGILRGLDINPLANPDLSALDAPTQAHFARGSYLVNAAICNDCHTNAPYSDFTTYKINTAEFLFGGAVFVTPGGLGPVLLQQRSMSANLLGANGFFDESGNSFTEFAAILANGEHIDENPPRPLAWPMPWDHFRNMELDDLESVYTYMRFMRQPLNGAPGKTTQPAAVWCDMTHQCPVGTCHMDNTFGNECIGQPCVVDEDCGACQHCDVGGTDTCVAPDPNVAADAACVNFGI